MKCEEPKEFFEREYILLGKSILQIEKEFGYSDTTIWKRLNDFGIKLRNKSETKLGNKNPMWKEGKIDIMALHQWVRRNKPKIYFCERCNIPENEVGFLDLANISGKYKRDINDYEWLCRRCHMNKDNRINNLKRGDTKGSKNGRAILNEEKVYRIKDFLKKNYSRKELAKLFNVKIHIIDNIATNKTWKDI